MYFMYGGNRIKLLWVLIWMMSDEVSKWNFNLNVCIPNTWCNNIYYPFMDWSECEEKTIVHLWTKLDNGNNNSWVLESSVSPLTQT